ncbi:MAG TPA: DMT family transporter [Paracoccaceae bacterium]|nr:DMT family transporter [Paracoccaceae bacterium]
MRALRSLFDALYQRPALLLVLVTLMWAGNAIAGQLARGEITPLQLVLARWGGVLVILWPIYGRQVAECWPVVRPRIWRVAAMGAIGFTAFNILFYWASLETSAVNIGILQGAVPVFVLIGAFLHHGTRVGLLQAVGVCITLVGVVLVATQGAPLSVLETKINIGDVLMLIACSFYAAYAVLLVGRPAIPGTAFFTLLATVAALTALPPAIAEALIAETYGWPTIEGWLIVIYVAVFPSCISQLFFMRGVDLIGPGRAGVYTNLVPVFAAAMAVGLLGQAFHAYHAVALVAVIGGIALAQHAPRRGAADVDSRPSSP